MCANEIVIKYASLDEILPVRKAVIIAGTNRDTPFFPGDDAPSTLHAGVFDDTQCIGCATLLYSEWQGAPAWQLRGMGVIADRQHRGIGRALLHFLERTLPEKALSDGIWCNARETATPFYTREGFQVMSERFLIENVGPHYKLYKPFSPLEES